VEALLPWAVCHRTVVRCSLSTWVWLLPPLSHTCLCLPTTSPGGHLVGGQLGPFSACHPHVHTLLPPTATFHCTLHCTCNSSLLSHLLSPHLHTLPFTCDMTLPGYTFPPHHTPPPGDDSLTPCTFTHPIGHILFFTHTPHTFAPCPLSLLPHFPIAFACTFFIFCFWYFSYFAFHTRIAVGNSGDSPVPSFCSGLIGLRY